MGTLRKKSCWRMVWVEKGTQRQVWYVCAAIDGALLGLAEVTHEPKGNKMRAK